MSVSHTLTVADRFSLTLEGLCRAVAARIAGGAMAAWMIVLVWGRVKRAERRVLGLLARFRAGRLLVRGEVVRSGGGGGRRPAGKAVLPRRFGWLLPLVPYEAAGFAGQLRTVLAEPDMAGLLAVSPQARRVLGPVCRMLGIEAEVLAGAEPVAAEVVAGRGDVQAGGVDAVGCSSDPPAGEGVTGTPALRLSG